MIEKTVAVEFILESLSLILEDKLIFFLRAARRKQVGWRQLLAISYHDSLPGSNESPKCIHRFNLTSFVKHHNVE